MILIIISLISIASVSANDLETLDLNTTTHKEIKVNTTSELLNQINKSESGDTILIEPGTYNFNNEYINKNLTLQGNGNPRDIIIDSEYQLGSIFLIKNSSVHVTFKNITFTNGISINFGGAISIETGNVYVDNCIFTNNDALSNTNAGAISNYGSESERSYLLVNNSLFINNHADHDGGAVTTCYASSDIYNSVFINNSAHRDGGAIRVSVAGYGNVEDCIFMYNHADEWGGAYYSWSGESNINRCIFLNNTAGTNGGAIMVSGNFNLTNSIIANNTGMETGGSFYIQQPMYDATTVINVHDNLITNNTSPYGSEIFIKWNDIKHLFNKFDNNDWGDKNPNDSSVIDPDNVTTRSKVTSTIKSNLLNVLSLNLLTKYSDLINDFFPEGYLESIENHDNENVSFNQNTNNSFQSSKNNTENIKDMNNKKLSNNKSQSQNSIESKIINDIHYNSQNSIGNSSTMGDVKNKYELNKSKSSSKSSTVDVKYIVVLIIVLAMLIGYRQKNKFE